MTGASAWNSRLTPSSGYGAKRSLTVVRTGLPYRIHQAGDRAASYIKAFAPQLPPDLTHAIDAEVGIEHASNVDPDRGVPPRYIRKLARIIAPRHMRVVGRWGNWPKLANRFAPVDDAMIIDERDNRLNGRSSAAIAKYADAFLRISLA